jgi:hypothetical protein
LRGRPDADELEIPTVEMLRLVRLERRAHELRPLAAGAEGLGHAGVPGRISAGSGLIRPGCRQSETASLASDRSAIPCAIPPTIGAKK